MNVSPWVTFHTDCHPAILPGIGTGVTPPLGRSHEIRRSCSATRATGGRSTGPTAAGLQGQSLVFAAAHGDHPRNRGGKTRGLHLRSNPVHVPAAADRGGHGRAPHVPRDEPHAPSPPIPVPALGL